MQLVSGEILSYYESLDTNKKLFWLYLILIFVEGTMRKWFMPSLSNIWMVCREPIVFYLFYVLFRKNGLKSLYATIIMLIGVVMFIVAITIGHGDVYVAFYGLRIWSIHIPFIFLMSDYLNRTDLKYICRFLILMAILMTPIYLAQFASPPRAFINARIGGAIIDSDMAANGAVRPTGLFGHVVGSSSFNPMIVSILVPMLFQKKYRELFVNSKFYFFLLIICVVLTAITSVQRGALFYSAIVLIGSCLSYSLVKGLGFMFNLIFYAIIGVLIFLFLSNVSIGGKNALAPTLARFESAAKTEKGAEGILQSRVLEPFRFWQEKGYDKDVPYLGYGIGAGSNYGTKKLGLGVSWGMGEWSSQIVSSEMGLFIGGIVFLLRIGFCFYLFPICFRLMVTRNDLLPLSLWFLVLFFFGNGNINMTITFGFIVLHMILLLLSIKTSE